jgi:pimeloyl-ACP methyl ester carboxylesterase
VRVGFIDEMSGGSHRRLYAALGGATALGLAGAVGERRHLKRIAADPQDGFLRKLPSGRPIGARSADGTQLHAEAFGPEGGPTVVLAHGWTEMLGYWTYVIRDLTARGLRVVAYDLRGHGHSEPAAGGDYSIARFGEDLEAVLEASVPDASRAVVGGHSLGAMSIAAWAEHHDVERRVSAAALLNTGVGDLLAEHLLIPVPAIAQLLNATIGPLGFLGVHTTLPRFSTPLSHGLIRYTAFGPSAGPAQVAFYERMLVACPPDVRADVGIAMSEMELHHALPRLTVPAIVLAGELDKLTPPKHAHRIAAELPQLERLIVLPGCGHMGPLERPREVSEALAGLVALAVGSAGPVAA